MKRQDSGSQRYGFTTWQQTCLITSTLIGVGVLTLPRTATSHLLEAGWMAPIVGSLGAYYSIWMIAKLSRRFPGMTFVEYSPLVWASKESPKLGKLLSLPWIFIYLSFIYVATGMVSRIFGEVVVTSVLLNTPLEVIMMTMFLLAFFLSLHEVDVVARVNEILFPLIIFPVLFIAIASFQKADWSYIFPLIRVSGKSIFEGAYEAVYSFSGFEIMLIYYAFSQHKAGKEKAGIVGILMTMVVYTLIVVAGITVFGYEELQRLTWPTLELVKTTQVPGLILERLESAFLAVWVAAVFTTVANAYYAVIYGLRQCFNKGILFQRIASAFLFIPLFFIALLPQNIVEIFQISSYIGIGNLVLNLGVPTMYWIVLFLRGKARVPKERKADG